jgi:hypothetical protein
LGVAVKKNINIGNAYNIVKLYYGNIFIGNHERKEDSRSFVPQPARHSGAESVGSG